jgi:hypothetical protein
MTPGWGVRKSYSRSHRYETPASRRVVERGRNATEETASPEACCCKILPSCFGAGSARAMSGSGRGGAPGGGRLNVS